MKRAKRVQDLRRRLAEATKRLRAARGLTFEALAKRADLSQRYLQKIEVGQANATLGTLAALARGLGVDASVLLKKGNTALGVWRAGAPGRKASDGQT